MAVHVKKIASSFSLINNHGIFGRPSNRSKKRTVDTVCTAMRRKQKNMNMNKNMNCHAHTSLYVRIATDWQKIYVFTITGCFK